jgi:glucokinase
MKMLLSVFDIGGTSIKYGIVNQDGEFLFHSDMPTYAFLGGDSVIQEVISIAKTLRQTWNIEGISISSAGQIDNRNGIVVFANDHIPEYTGLNVKQMVEEELRLPVKVENDVNCTAIGEHWKGIAKGVNDFLCITIGTGIGGALFFNGELYSGPCFAAGEVGHITLYPNGRKCVCGSIGCWEQYASSLAFERLAKEAFGKNMDLATLFQLIKSGDPKAVKCYDPWLDDLTTGLRSIIHTLNPKLVIIGGGISAQGEFLLHSIRKTLIPKLMPNHERELEIKIALNGNKANLLGAAKSFFDHTEGGKYASE